MFNGNKILLSGNKQKCLFGFIPGLFVRFKGKNSKVIIHEPIPKFSHTKIRLGNNCTVEIGSDNKLNWKIQKLNIKALGDNQKVKIGNAFKLNGANIFLGVDANTSVEIGEDCMFSSGINIMCTDSHTIYDLSTHEILNKDKSIKIGNHVWLAEDVTILKGTTIGDNIIIGKNSLVTRDCLDSNSVYAGSPVEKRKQNVNWSVQNPSKDIKEEVC